jgi:hypothetical protein
MIKTVPEKSKVTLLANCDKTDLINSWLLYEMKLFIFLTR